MKKYNLSFNIDRTLQLVVCFLLTSISMTVAQDDFEGGINDFGTGSFQSQKMVIPPAPNAATLGKFGEYNVSNYTGALNLSIPIYTYLYPTRQKY